jgi:crossover junction endodeoxyribonuclease RuvC
VNKARVRIFGIDPGSVRTGYGCIETDGTRHHLVACGAIAASARLPFPDRLLKIHVELTALLARCRPDGVAVESLFHAVNARSALQLGHARGVALLAASQAGVPIAEYTPAEIKRAVVGYGRAEKTQVQQMIRLLLGLAEAPQPLDVSDALAVAICHSHHCGQRDLVAAAIAAEDAAAPRGSVSRGATARSPVTRSTAKSWRNYKVAEHHGSK